jgi:DNA-3-methyladenine glycosylase II
MTDESILLRTHEELRLVGLSNRKAEYIVGIAQAWKDGLHALDWGSMSDEEILEKLIALRGVGRWTAEMILIFSLLRPDVFPIDDIGVIRGMERVYNSRETLSKPQLNAIAEKWKPYRTLGSWYMWRAIDPEPIEY